MSHLLDQGCGTPGAKSALYVDWPGLAIGGDDGEDYPMSGTGSSNHFVSFLYDNLSTHYLCCAFYAGFTLLWQTTARPRNLQSPLTATCFSQNVRMQLVLSHILTG